MTLSPIKQEILETLLLEPKPVKAMDIAKEINKEFNPVMMHLLGLTRMGCVASPEKSTYVITERGKRTIGVPETSKEKAAAILAYAPHDKSFNFYSGIDKPLGQHAHTVRDFANKMQKLDVASLEFHMGRGDFEAWFRGLGDEETAKKLAILKQRNLKGEHLREHLHEITEQRYAELASLAGIPVPVEDQEHTHQHHNHTH